MTTETIEGEVRQLPAIRPEAGIAATGALALAALSDDEFDRRLAALEKGADRIARIQRALMKADVDYGVIPGTKKPTLLKPGAEKLCLAYSLAADFAPDRSLGDGEVAPAISYLTRCDLHLGDLDGPIVAVGYGAANSWEVRYRYRKAERVCPKCGVAAIIKGKAEYGGGWVCWKKRDGCDAKFPDGDAAIDGQEVGQTENPDPWDLDVTLAKMAEKRAHIDATLRATGASALFTQDMEDRPQPEPEPARQEPVIERDGLIGTAVKQQVATTDFAIRYDPKGIAHLGFRLQEGSRSGVICEVTGQMAEDIIDLEADTIGQRVQIWGAFVGRTVKSGATYRAFAVTKIKTAAYELPAEDRSAPSAAMFAEGELEAVMERVP